MGLERLKDLAPRERECLRLVSKDRGSDEIAALLGISRETVETLIKRARAKLGGISRFAAARALADWEGRPQSRGTDETGTDNSLEAVSIGPSSQPPEAEPDRQTVNEERPSFTPPGGLPPTVTARRTRNAFQPLMRLTLLTAGAALLVITALGMMAVAKELQQWLSPTVAVPKP